ncbi:GAF domain-containing protein [bacterium]|nr:GAF domain-containing protein [bacterium]MBU1633655.1 GAF domain-containing protein [bacterium]MBU1873555.1 GAF domain-containing protein [bacterium]
MKSNPIKHKKIQNSDLLCQIENKKLREKIQESPAEVQQYLSALCNQIQDLSKIGAALSAERNLPKLLEMILEEARHFTNSDGGTLYMMNDDGQSLRFEIVQTSSLNIRMGGTSGNTIDWYPVRLYLQNGKPNHAMVSAHVGLSGEVINIPDVYDVKGFDFTGTRAFDSKTGYRSKSMLVVPMRNHEDEIIGVLQLLNALNPVTNEPIPFTNADQGLIISLASQAAVAITNTRLIHDLELLLESFIQVIASAIDEKSPYTGGHIERVAKLTMMIAENINNIDYGIYAPLFLNHDELKELRIASWMHDIGKITTPEYVVDKSSKLETIYDRINTVSARFEVLKRDAKIELLEHKLKIANGESLENIETVEESYRAKIRAIDDDIAFITTANIGGEYMAPEKQERVKEIGQQKIEMVNETRDLLDEDEILNLCIPKGTLTNEEREIINHHVVMTITMLEKLPYPKKLRRVPEYAGGHHEKLDGTGYPYGLNEDQLSPQSRMMALADIFEALTARDRPYKKGKTLSEAMKIMGFMAKDKHIDPELFKIFVQEKLYLKYAQENMDPSQIDDIDPKVVQ